MTHRRWTLFGYGADSIESATREHNALYDAWEVERNRATDMLDENNRLDRELDEARERIAELEDRPEANVRWSCSQMDFAMHLFGMDAQSGVGANCNYERAGRAMDYLAKHALVPPTRVPFSDAQIERMAEAACDGWGDNAQGIWFTSSDNAKSCWRDCIRAALAAGGLEPCAVPEYAPDDVALRPHEDQVEALARVLHKRQDTFYCRYGDHATKFDDHTPLWRTMARAAIAHLAKRPEVSTKPVDLWAVITSIVDVRVDCDGCDYVEIDRTNVSDLEVALRPWLRDPAGFELDAHPDQLELYKWVTEPDGGYAYAAQQAIDLCRSRIRPVYECKECRQWRKDWDTQAKAYEMLSKAYNAASKQLNAARAALEGE